MPAFQECQFGSTDTRTDVRDWIIGAYGHVVMINLILLGAIPFYVLANDGLRLTPLIVTWMACLPLGLVIAIVRTVIRRQSRSDK